ncbi:MAG: AbrB/MazE/SpoVT family DNA-binding domain-containing protein [Desulfobacterales bacterium]|jgi:antitoxin PrlF|nr:AbrB/MazE/SpoVT family DNA-binding domain-containing protein [Desulfobacterales bacterium]
MIATITSKGQVTIPKAIRNVLNIRPKDKIDFVRRGDKVFLVPIKTLKDLRGSVAPHGKGDFMNERRAVKAAVSKRVVEETK